MVGRREYSADVSEVQGSTRIRLQCQNGAQVFLLLDGSEVQGSTGSDGSANSENQAEDIWIGEDCCIGADEAGIVARLVCHCLCNGFSEAAC